MGTELQDVAAAVHGADAGISLAPLDGKRRNLMRRALVLTDVATFAASLVLASLVLGPRAGSSHPSFALWLILPLWLVVADARGLYRRHDERIDHSSVDDVVAVAASMTFAIWGYVAGAVVLGQSVELRQATIAWGVAIVLVTSGRIVVRAVCRDRPAYLQNTLLVGSGAIAARIAGKIVRHPEYGLNLVGYVDDEAGGPEWREEIAHLGGVDRLDDLVQLLDVERVIVAFPHDRSADGEVMLVRRLQSCGVRVDLVPRAFELISPHNGIHTIEGVPVVGLNRPRLSATARAVKRSLDLVVSTIALIVLSPVFLVMAVVIKRDSPGPVFFRQVRMGQGSRPFELLKFRTMMDGADQRKVELEHLNIHANRAGPRMFKIWEDPRVTGVGRKLRKYFIDELPQLINVLRGEMSLVGPRPLVLEEDGHVSDWARRRLDLKPGMTGLWQVTGRSGVPFTEMIELDYLYVMNWSVRTDLRILARTVPLVVRGDGGAF
ncbi:MAG: sugar transferase [Gaiellaceae bacterium]